MPRTMLTDKAWEALKQILKETGRVYNKYEHRNTLEGLTDPHKRSNHINNLPI